MAFNPFHSFRKNSKILMAGLTIFVMFVFVLSYGGGGGHDFFDWVARLFGASDRRGPVLVSIEGVDYYGHDLQEIRTKRAAANLYLQTAVQVADERMFKEILKELPGSQLKDQDAKDLLEIALYYRVYYGDQTIQQLRQFAGGNLQQLSGFLEQYFRDKGRIARPLAEIVAAFDNPFSAYP